MPVLQRDTCTCDSQVSRAGRHLVSEEYNVVGGVVGDRGWDRRDCSCGQRVLVDVATMITAGGEAIADIDTLRHQQDVLGAVASPPTVWRTLDELTPAALKRIDHARAKTRARVWSSSEPDPP